jgi:hypothetical protein
MDPPCLAFVQFFEGMRYVACWSACVERLLIVDPGTRPDAAQMLRYVEHVLSHLQRGEASTCMFEGSQIDYVSVGTHSQSA